MINVRVDLVRNSNIAMENFNTARINFTSLWSQVLSDSLRDRYYNFKGDDIQVSLIQIST